MEIFQVFSIFIQSSSYTHTQHIKVMVFAHQPAQHTPDRWHQRAASARALCAESYA